MGMISEFKAATDVFHEGKELANSVVWKNRQVAGNHVTLLLIAGVGVAKGFGYDINIDRDTLEIAGMGIGAVVVVINQVLNVITSTRVGINPKL